MARNDKYGSVSTFDGIRDMPLTSSYNHYTMMATNNNLIHHHHPLPTTTDPSQIATEHKHNTNRIPSEYQQSANREPTE